MYKAYKQCDGFYTVYNGSKVYTVQFHPVLPATVLVNIKNGSITGRAVFRKLDPWGKTAKAIVESVKSKFGG